MLNKHESWSIANRLISLFSNSLILLFMAKYLFPQDVALWYIFLAIFGVVGIVEGGFIQTISRHITYINNGKETHSNIDINDFININTKIFTRLVMIISFTAALFGTYYLHTIDSMTLTFFDYTNWLLFIISAIIALFTNLYASILIGFEKVADVQKNQIYTILLNLVLVTIFLFVISEKNISSVVVSYLLSQLLLLILNFKLAIQYFDKSKGKQDNKKIKRIVWHDMKKMFLNILSYKLLTSLFFIVLGNYIAVETLASYGLTLQIFTYIISFSTIFITSNIPKFASLFGRNLMNELNKIYLKKSLLSITITVVSIGIIYKFDFIISEVFELKTNLLSIPLLNVFLLFFFIEFVISQISTYLLVCNNLNYVYLSLIASISIVVTSYVGLEFFNLTIDSIFLSRALLSFCLMLLPMLYMIFILQKKGMRYEIN